MNSYTWIQGTVAAVRRALLVVGLLLLVVFGSKAFSRADSWVEVAGQPHLFPIFASGQAASFVAAPHTPAAAMLAEIAIRPAANFSSSHAGPYEQDGRSSAPKMRTAHNVTVPPQMEAMAVQLRANAAAQKQAAQTQANRQKAEANLMAQMAHQAPVK